MPPQLKATRSKHKRVYLHTMTVDALQEKLTSPNTQGKIRQKIKNELVRRGIEV